MPLYQLGSEVFLSMHRTDNPAGMPEVRIERSRIYQEDGLDGVSIKRVGFKGVPFQVQSIRDCSSNTVAVARVAAYQDMAGGEFGLVWYGLNLLSEFQTTYVVLDVSQMNVKRVFSSVGGVSGTSDYVVEATWTLIATEPST